MEMMTRNGVCYDFTKSEYRHTVDGLTFVFSSKLHLNKFKKRLRENRDIVNYSLTKRFNIPVDVAQLADVVLYRKIETRGFLIYTESGGELVQNKMKYIGGEVVNHND